MFGNKIDKIFIYTHPFFWMCLILIGIAVPFVYLFRLLDLNSWVVYFFRINKMNEKEARRAVRWCNAQFDLKRNPYRLFLAKKCKEKALIRLQAL